MDLKNQREIGGEEFSERERGIIRKRAEAMVQTVRGLRDKMPEDWDGLSEAQRDEFLKANLSEPEKVKIADKDTEISHLMVYGGLIRMAGNDQNIQWNPREKKWFFSGRPSATSATEETRKQMKEVLGEDYDTYFSE